MIKKAFSLLGVLCFVKIYSGGGMSCIRLTDDDNDNHVMIAPDDKAKKIVFNALVSYDITSDINQFKKATGLEVQVHDHGMQYFWDEGMSVFYQPTQSISEKNLFIAKLGYAAFFLVLQHNKMLD